MATRTFTKDDLYEIGHQGICREAARRLSSWDASQHFVPEPWFNPVAGIVARMFKDPLYASKAAARKREGNLFYWRNQQAGKLGLTDSAGKLLFYCHPQRQPEKVLAEVLLGIAERYNNGGLIMHADELVAIMRYAGVTEDELDQASQTARFKGHGQA